MVTFRSLVGGACAAALTALAVNAIAGTALTPTSQASATTLHVHPHEGVSGARPTAASEGYASLTGSALSYTSTAHVGATSISFNGTAAAYFDDKFTTAPASGSLVWSAPIQIPSRPPAKVYNKFLQARAGSKSLSSVEVASSGKVVVRDGAGKLRATSSVALTVNTWYLVEAMFSSGAVRVRLFTSTGNLVSDIGPVATAAGVPTALRTGLRAAGGPMLIDRVVIGDSWLTGTTPPSTPPPTTPPPTTLTNQPDSPVIVAAGDIACAPGSAPGPQSCRHAETAKLLAGADRVLALGDSQYNEGTLEQFTGPGTYHDTWGWQKSITRPVPGNHEYRTPGAAGYFNYFGEVAGTPGKGYYSYDLGTWHLIALNTGSTADVPTGRDSAQAQWLREDLAGHSNQCVLAYWHHPRFSAGSYYPGVTASTTAFWEDLYAASADVVINGHDHAYQRFAPQTPTGAPDQQQGIREFVVGTGGKSLYGINSSLPNLEDCSDTRFGVLKMTLHASSYTWAFVDENGVTIDNGSAPCV